MFLHDLLSDGRTSIWFHAGISICTIIWIFSYCRRRGSNTIGLPFCYVLLLAMIHFGAYIYLLPWYDPDTDPYLRSQGVNLNEVASGYALTVLGMVGFALGIFLCDKVIHISRRSSDLQIHSVAKFGRQLVVAGAISFFVIFPVSGRIPSGTAIASAGVNLSGVGLCLLSFNSLRQVVADRIRVLFATLTVPSITMLFLGFVGYGVAALIQIFSYVSSFVRLRSWHFPVALFVFWLTLSFYVTYMSGRDKLREVVWRGASFTERLQVFYERLSQAQSFDPFNTKHLHAIDGRLNQNALVGKSVEFMRHNQREFANGQTLYVAAVAWVPRILWPGKPTFGGSGSLVADYTGMYFDSSTSVGIGQVMEFYINFGQVGVLVGFLLFGMVIRYVDRRAAANLEKGEYWEYTRFHLMGICALQPGGLMAEVVASAAAAWVLTILMKQYFIRNQSALA